MAIVLKSKDAPKVILSHEFPEGYSLKYRFPTQNERMYVDAIATNSPLLLGEKAAEAAKRIGELGAAATEYRLKAVIQGWDGFVEEVEGKQVPIPFSWNAFAVACQQVPTLFNSAMDIVHSAWRGKTLADALATSTEDNKENPTSEGRDESKPPPSAGSAAEDSQKSSATPAISGAT